MIMEDLNTRNLDEESAKQVLKEFVEGDLYILLSTVSADMIRGISFPYVGNLEQGKIILLFSDLDYAKNFCENEGFEVLDGVYPLSKIMKDNPQLNLEMTVKIAGVLGVTNIDFNPGHHSLAFGVTIQWMQDVLGYDKRNISVVLTKKEMEELEKGELTKGPLRFNPLPILNFSNPYRVSEKRMEELGKIPFNNSETVGKFVDNVKLLPLNELICLSEIINRRYMAQAKKENREEDIKNFGTMYGVLDQIIIHRLSRIPVYTLLDNGETFINKNKAAYIMYTDRFQYMGEYRYKETGLEDLCEELEQKDINMIFVSAGPGEMHLTSVSAIKTFMANDKAN